MQYNVETDTLLKRFQNLVCIIRDNQAEVVSSKVQTIILEKFILDNDIETINFGQFENESVLNSVKSAKTFSFSSIPSKKFQNLITSGQILVRGFRLEDYVKKLNQAIHEQISVEFNLKDK